MTAYERSLLVIAMTVLAVSGWWLQKHPLVLAQTPPVRETLRSTRFSNEQINRFLADAMTSETMTDPLQRCLKYPDPPDSHWSHTAVAAYCRYRTQSFLTLPEAQDLIREGRADELDRRLADALLRQRSQSDSRGLLDHIYYNDFNDGSATVRATLDAWKRELPKSAFAHAASGLAYVAAAGDARGGKWVSDTPASNLAAMDKLLTQARADLDVAMELNPQVTPTYAAMLIAARMDGDDRYAVVAVKSGLEADPANYSLHAQLLVSAEPKWGGSLDAMKEIARRAKAKSETNPLLLLLLPEPAAYASGICGCGDGNPNDHAAYQVVLDQVAATATLSSAGNNALSTGQPAIAVVYLSEALRFDPRLVNDRMERINGLGTIRYQPILRDQANRAMLAEADRLMALAPSDSWTLAQLGQVYVGFAQWEKAWNIADHLTHAHPEEINGWVLRAIVQKTQPRPGLRDTAEYIIQHFANDPEAGAAVEQAREDLAAGQQRTP